MNCGPAALEHRKRHLVAMIAAQRSHFETELGALRGPLLAFAVARGFGETLRRNATLALAVAGGTGFILTRGGLLSKGLRGLQLASRTARWWVLARLGWQFLRRSNSSGAPSGATPR